MKPTCIGNGASFHSLSLIVSFIISFSPWGRLPSTLATVIQTSSGRITGYHVDLAKEGWAGEGDVVRFYGIPYAEPPVGPLRFYPTKALLEKDNHYANIDVKNEYPPPPCPQTLHLPEFSHESLPPGGENATEDCLKLNVYLPGKFDSSKTLPILIWIPGEGFNYADIIQYDGSALAAKGSIVVVTVNYRVGVFGFMSSGNATLRGNAGLHDILNAINWIQVNAHAIHGDPNSITLAGRFSGSMAISSLVVSPLFLQSRIKDGVNTSVPIAKRVILHGGIATGQYVMDDEPLQTLTVLSDITHCTRLALEDTISCLQALPADKLLTESGNVPQHWKPVVDDYLLLADPLELMLNNKFPAHMDLLIGDNNGAGSLCFLTHSYLKTELLSKIKDDTLEEKDLTELIKRSLQEFYEFKEGSDALAAIVSHEYMFYEADKSERTAWLKFCGAMYIRYPVELAARAVARSGRTRVYRYQWDYKPSNSPWSEHKWLTSPLGDEIIFVFPNNNTKFSKVDMKVRDSFMISWINFVQTGNVSEPTTSWPNWPSFDDDAKEMMSFQDSGDTKLTTSSFLDRDVHFWREAIEPLTKTLRRFDKLNENFRTCRDPFPRDIPQPTALSQALLAIVILMGLTVGIFCIYFFVKNWGKPRTLWRF